MRLLLIGCTGFVGRELVPQLLKKGHHLTIVSRKNIQQLSNILPDDCLANLIELNPANLQNWKKEQLLIPLSKADGVINLAGEPIAERRWTSKHREKLQTSRLNTTQGLVNAMSGLKRPPKVLINGSAIGFYGTSLKDKFNEDSRAGEDFLARLCQQWEATALQKPRSTRLIIFRIGIVLGPNGGALGKMVPIFKTGLGGPIGDGNQWMSWIHRSDLCQMIEQALTNKSWSGVINAVAPQPSSMKDFATDLGKSLGKRSLFQVPAAILKLLLGDGARVVIEGQQVESIKLHRLGFEFNHSNLKEAFANINHQTN